MALISDQLAREHLRVEDDVPIDVYVRAAEQWAIEYLNRNIYVDQAALDAAVDENTAGDHPMVVNDLVQAGILTLVGHLFENRESVVVGATVAKVPMSVTFLLHPYRKGLGA